MKKTAIIMFLSLLAYAVHAQTFELDEETLDLDPDVYEAGAAADSIPAYDNAPFVRCNDEIVVNRSRLEFIDLMTGKYVASPQSFADNGIYGFYIMGQLPRQIHVFLKYGNEYTVLEPAKYGEYDMSAVKDQISIIFRHFKAVRESAWTTSSTRVIFRHLPSVYPCRGSSNSSAVLHNDGCCVG